MSLSKNFNSKSTTSTFQNVNGSFGGDAHGRAIYHTVMLFILLMTLSIFYTSPAFAKLLPDYATLVEEQSAAVVRITAVAPTIPASSPVPDNQQQPENMPEFFRRFFEQMPNQPNQPRRRGAGFGSGFIVSEDGYVVTNAHVVDGAEDIRVSLHDQREFDAKLIGADERTDIALLKIDVEDLPVVNLGDSDEVQVGQWVLAIGAPFGFDYTATQGIVSAVSRSLRGDNYVPFIQTDAAVNPGNSGGPLFDTEGNVIGVNSQIYTRSGGFMGLSFAIPANVVKSVTAQLKEKGYASYGWLGVLIQNLDKSLAESFGLDRPRGALVAQVSDDSPAEDAGIKTGDVILSFGGKPVDQSTDLPSLVGSTPPGDVAEVELIRDGKALTLQVTVRELEQDRVVKKTSMKAPKPENILGMKAKSLSDEDLQTLDIENGVLAAEVAEGSPAAQAGIRTGDVIVSFNKIDVKSLEQLSGLIKEAPKDAALPVLVLRNRAPHFLALTVPKA